MDLHEPPQVVETGHRQVSQCVQCPCTSYNRDPNGMTSITCMCGHEGSAHISKSESTGSRHVPARTKKSELIPGVYDASNDVDMDATNCLVM